MTPPLNKFIDHTCLKPSATAKEIKKLCEEAGKWDFACVCVQPVFVALAKKLLAKTDVKVCTVIGFPLGVNKTAIKVFEAETALKDGCEEFDMVLNVGAVKARDFDGVRREIAAVVKAAQGKIVKVILETFYLDDEEKSLAAKLAAEAGADFVKTCTGFNAGVATAHDVKIMKGAIKDFPSVKVKASAGIRSLSAARELIEAGAERLGTSAGVAIMEEYRTQSI
ncbi:MAG: deoxyribose-phosphate aldolase [Victivallaceae bacterium]|nr:deoxyribose-phosphate aldolase [Victivallaceae bacterium]